MIDLQEILLRTPMSFKIVLATLLIGLTGFYFLDKIQVNSLRVFFQHQMIERLSHEVQDDRLAFDNALRTYNQFVKVVAFQKSFQDYIDHLSSLNWGSEKNPEIIFHQNIPEWFPESSLIRAFVNLRFAILLDPAGRVREIIRGIHRTELPPTLLKPVLLIGQLSHEHSIMTEVDGIPYHLTMESLKDESGNIRASLMLASPLDNDFLAFAVRHAGRDNIVALADSSVIFASSKPNLIAVGENIMSLKKRFLYSSKSFFDYGSSDLDFRFITFISIEEVNILTEKILHKERMNHIIAALSFIFLFMLLVFLYTRRIKKLTNYITDFSTESLGTEHRKIKYGDQLFILEESFRLLMTALKSTHKKLTDSKEELEITVERRTADLRDANNKLRSEINDRKQTEYQLKHSLKLLQTLMDSIPDSIYFKDEQNRFVKVNKAKAEHSKTTVEDMVGKTDFDFFPADQAGSAFEDDSEIVKTGLQIKDKVEKLTHVDGSVRWLSVTKIPWLDENEKIIGSIGISRDITRHKTDEEELRKNTLELQRSNQELQDFANVASHDLQEPLRKIVAFGDRIQSKYYEVLDENGRDYLNRMKKAASRMQQLIEDLLLFSRVTTKAHPFEPTDLSTVIKDVLNDLEERLLRTKGTVAVEELCTVEADRMQMRQLFQNLLSNSLKYHKKDVSPFVTIKTDSADEGFCRIVVSDNGIGFDEKYLNRIFKPFQRLHGRDMYEGTGMGLAICSKIVNRHNGELTAVSSSGKGTTFKVTLPLSKNEKQ